MNHNRMLLKTLVLGSLLALALSVAPLALRAGLPPSASHRVANADDLAVNPADTTAMVCGACKTTALVERRLLPGTKAGTALSIVGSKHECAMCGGEITTANGATVDSMGRNCVVCGSSVTSCCTAPTVSQKG